MKTAPFPDWRALLQLALVLFAAVLPAGRTVLCIEEDGCVRLESAVDSNDCRGCDRHDEPELAQADAKAGEHATPDTRERSLEPEACPCSDVECPSFDARPAGSGAQALDLGIVRPALAAWLAEEAVRASSRSLAASAQALGAVRHEPAGRFAPPLVIRV